MIKESNSWINLLHNPSSQSCAMVLGLSKLIMAKLNPLANLFSVPWQVQSLLVVFFSNVHKFLPVTTTALLKSALVGSLT